MKWTVLSHVAKAFIAKAIPNLTEICEQVLKYESDLLFDHSDT